MPLQPGRIILSIITLNSLLQTYENQPVEFYDSNLMVQHPKLTSFYNANQMINLLAGISQIFFIDWKYLFNTFASMLFGISVILQNINFYLPKTLNMIEIYLQTLVILYQIIVFFSSQYELIQGKFHIKFGYGSNPRILHKKNQPCHMQQRKIYRKNNFRIGKQKQIENELNVKEQIKEIEKINLEDEKQQLQQDPISKIEEETHENQIVIKQENISETEIETDVQNEIVHWDLSEISSTKSEKNLTIQIKLNNQQQIFCCNFDSFDNISSLFNSSYTEKQITEAKTHILLNLYDENEDCTLRLWCLKKLLSIIATV